MATFLPRNTLNLAIKNYLRTVRNHYFLFPLIKKCTLVLYLFYPEKYRHYSGELTYGETSVAKPVLGKYWGKVKDRLKA